MRGFQMLMRSAESFQEMSGVDVGSDVDARVTQSQSFAFSAKFSERRLAKNRSPPAEQPRNAVHLVPAGIDALMSNDGYQHMSPKDYQRCQPPSF